MLLTLSAPWGTAWAAAKEPGNADIGKVTQLREKFKYDDALKMIEEAKKRPSNTREQLATLDLLEGVLRYEARQQQELAEQLFLSALTVTPEAQIPWDVGPKITDLLEKVRERVKRRVETPAAATPGGEERPGPTPPPNEERRDRLIPYRIPLAIAGGGLAAVGVFSWSQAKSTEQRLRAGDASITTRAQFDDAVRRGKTFETVGWILAGTGVATTLGSLLLLRPSRAAPSLSAMPTQGGAHVSLLWRTP